MRAERLGPIVAGQAWLEMTSREHSSPSWPSADPARATPIAFDSGAEASAYGYQVPYIRAYASVGAKSTHSQSSRTTGT